MRYADQMELWINRWLFFKNIIVLVLIVPAHTDKKAWNTGDGNAHPVEKSWADRFLIYPNDPSSSPCRKAAASAKDESPGPPKFTLSGTNGYLISYGDGPRICPGRYFAKRGTTAACAIMTTMFDIEVLADDKAHCDESCFSWSWRPKLSEETRRTLTPAIEIGTLVKEKARH